MPSNETRRHTALVTGANRGIGLEACRQLARTGVSVILTARRLDAGGRAAAELRAEGLDVSFELLDVADRDSVEACASRLTAAHADVDILVNNAAVYPTTPVLRLDESTLTEALEINVLGAWRLCRAFVPAMIDRQWGRVVNISSGGGAICEATPGPGAYGISKTALNALTREVADAAGPRVKVNAMCPGWVATDMGGPHAPITVEDACDTLVWLATLPDDGPTNGFYRNRRRIPW